MRQLTLIVSYLVVFTAAAGAQPQHGDLILTVASSNWSSGYTGFVRPSAPGKLTTISVAPTNQYHNWVRMAPDNTSIAVSESNPAWTPCHLIHLTPGGSRTTIARNLDEISAFELDHDGHWIAATTYASSAPRRNQLLRIADPGGAVTILASFPSSTMSFNDVSVDRELGAPAYVVACGEQSTLFAPKILGVDGRGSISTLVVGAGEPLLWLTGIELHARSGNYLTTDQMGPSNGGGMEVNLVSKSGGVSSLAALLKANGARINQDDTAWIIGYKMSLLECYLMHYDLATSVVMSVSTLHLGGPSVALTGIEIYGSRALVCNQPPTRTPVAVTVQSRHLQAGGANYALAASFARRPPAPANCLRFPNGEYLCLDVTGPLFFLSALGVVPTVFQNFQGTLDPFGNARAHVNVPALPPNLGITVFVAGVIFNPKQGVIQVTNTHWFVL